MKKNSWFCLRLSVCAFTCLALFTNCLQAQIAGTRPLTIAEVVATARERYPSLRVSQAEVKRAAFGISAARTAYLPKADLIAGVNRASRNNVLGLLLPSQIIAPISGPVIGGNGTESAWGSTVGVLVSWEPFDFGLRSAGVGVAKASQRLAEASATRTKLELETLAADSAITLLAAEQTAIAAQAAVTRAGELQRITDALVKSDLRPGADASLARAESAAAQAQLIRARQAIAEAKAALAALVGTEPNAVAIAGDRLQSLPGKPPEAQELSVSPPAREQDAAVAESRARLKVIDRSYIPHFSLQGTSYARGTGALADGRILGGGNGLGPNIQNWAVGFTANFSVLEFSSIRARHGAESARLEAEQQRYKQTLIELKSRRDQALAAFQGASEIVPTTAVAMESARAAVEQSRARYKSGLGSELEVAETQRRLAQAEIDDRLARLSVWRAKLAVSAINGDIGPLLTEASQ